MRGHLMTPLLGLRTGTQQGGAWRAHQRTGFDKMWVTCQACPATTPGAPSQRAKDTVGWTNLEIARPSARHSWLAGWNEFRLAEQLPWLEGYPRVIQDGRCLRAFCGNARKFAAELARFNGPLELEAATESCGACWRSGKHQAPDWRMQSPHEVELWTRLRLTVLQSTPPPFR